MIGAMVWIGNLKSPLVGDRDLDKLALSRIYGRFRRYQIVVIIVSPAGKEKGPDKMFLTDV